MPQPDRTDAATSTGPGAGGVLLQGRSALAELPLWAQVLVALRMTLRLLQGGADTAGGWRAHADAALAATQACIAEGNVDADATRVFDAWSADRPDNGPASLDGALNCVLDAARAAAAALDFAIDDTVTHSALRAISHLAADVRVAPMQLLVSMAADIDQLRFACGEARVGRYDALPKAVFLRLAPAHPLAPLAPRTEAPSWR